jgi:Zn-finger nucleic acid-binding protein
MLDQCTRCSGLFLDRPSFETLIGDPDQQAIVHAALSQTTEPADPVRSHTLSSVKYVPCPECSELMSRRNFGKISGVIVDVCGPHGTWFDDEELNRVVKFVQGGGLLKSQQRELDTVKRQLEEKRARFHAAPVSTWEARFQKNNAWAEAFVEAATTIFWNWR